MSVSYKLIGKRWLRKMTLKPTPVYSALADVNKIANTLCDLSWQRVSPKDAVMTYHTSNIVVYTNAEKTEGITGLDYNVQIRDEFDAALFCSDHTAETHKAHANAACYKFVLPDMDTYPVLESLLVNITSDPYNSLGARLAIFTNSTGEIPTSCVQCRQGCAPSNSHSCTHTDTAWTTNDTYADGVAPRIAVTSGTGDKATTSWYPQRGTCTFAPTGGLQLQKYLYVFVLMENYNTYRGNWVEGCSFIDNLIEITTSSAVGDWTAGDKVDLSSEEYVTAGESGSSETAVSIVKDNVIPDITGAVSPVVTASVLSSGTVVRTTDGVADSLSQVNDEITSSNVSSGIVTLYGKLHEGDLESGNLSCCCPKYKTFGVGFCVSHGNGGTFRDASGHVANPMALNLTASSLMIPFSIPVGFDAAKIKFDWSKWLRSSAPSSGAKFNFWIKQGSFDGEYPSSILKNHVLYDATDDAVGEWTLLGTADASDGSVAYSIDEKCPSSLEGVATILITAYIAASRVPAIVDTFQRGTNSMWYDCTTPDDLLSVMDTYDLFSETSQYVVGDVVQYGTNEAEKWSMCPSTKGVKFTSIATNGRRWVAASSSGIWYSYGADGWKKSNVTTAVDKIAFFRSSTESSAGVFVAYHGTTVYANTDGLGETWSSATVPASVISLDRGGQDSVSGPVLLGTASGVYSLNTYPMSVTALSTSIGSVNDIGHLYGGTPVVAASRGLYKKLTSSLSKASIAGSFRSIAEVCVGPSSSSLLAASNCGVFRSSDPSAWNYVTGLTANVNEVCYANGVFVLATDTGLYRYSSSIGYQFVDSIASKKFTHAFVANGVAFAYATDGTLYRSEDSAEWALVLTVEGLDVSSIAYGDGWMLIGAASASAGTDGTSISNWLSTDGGSTWIENGALLTPGYSSASSITSYTGKVNASITAGTRTFVLTDRTLWYQSSGRVYDSSTETWKSGCVVLTPQFVDTVAKTSGIYGHGRVDPAEVGPWYCAVDAGSVTGLSGTFLAGTESGLFKLTPGSDVAGTTRDFPLWKQDSSFEATGAVRRIIHAVSDSANDHVNTLFLVADKGFFRYLGPSDAVEKVYAYSAIPQGNYGTAYAYTCGCPDCPFVFDRWYSETNYIGWAQCYRVTYHDYDSTSESSMRYLEFYSMGYHAVPVTNDTVTFYNPSSGLSSTIPISFSCPSGESTDVGNWVATVNGGDFDGTVLTTVKAAGDTNDPFPFNYALGGMTKAYANVTLKFTLYLKFGALRGGDAGPTITAAYASYVSYTKSIASDRNADLTFYDIFGHSTAVTWTTENSEKVMNVSFGAPLWTNLSSTLNRSAFDGNTPDFSLVQWTGSCLVLPIAGSRKVYKSTDLGYNWTASEALVEYGEFTKVAGSPSGSTMVAANAEGFLFVSTDGALSWKKVSDLAATVDGISCVNGKWFAWTSTSLYVSTAGDSWTAVTGAPVSISCIDYVHGRYTLGTANGIYWSSDGSAWTQSDWEDATYQIDHWSDRLFSASENGVAYSGDKVLLNEAIVKGQVVPGFNKIYYTGSAWIGCGYSGSGLFLSTDGNGWVQSNVISGTFYDVCATSSALYAVGTVGIYKSTDGGTSWTQENGITEGFTGIEYDSTTGKAIAYGVGMLYVLSGSTWTSVFPAFTVVRGNGAGKFVACSTKGLFYSTDCVTWRPVTSLFGTAFTDLRYDAGKGEWSAKCASGWYSSSDSTTWAARDTPTDVILTDFCPATEVRSSVDFGYNGTTAYGFFYGVWTTSTPEVGTILGIARFPSNRFYVAGTGGVKTCTYSYSPKWKSVSGVTGTPKKILYCGKASSIDRCFVLVLTEEGKVYVNHSTDDASGLTFYDITPAGATVTNILCDNDYDGLANWYAVSDLGVCYSNDPTYETSTGAITCQWLYTVDAPDGLTEVMDLGRNLTGYGLANGSLYQLGFTLDSPNSDQPIWTRLAVKDDLTFGSALSNSIHDDIFFFGSGGRIYALDSSNNLTLAFVGGGSTFKGAAMDGAGNCMVVGPKGVAYKSADSGATWAFADRGSSVDLADVIYFSKASKWLTVGSGGIQYSSDGSSWTATGVTASRTKLCVGAESVVACGSGGISSSINGTSWVTSTFSGVTTVDAAYTSGDKWTEVSGISDTFKSIEWDSTNSRFIATSLKYKYVSTDGGETWTVNPWEQEKVVEVGTTNQNVIIDGYSGGAYYYLHLHDGCLYPFRKNYSSTYFDYASVLSPTNVIDVKSFVQYTQTYADDSGASLSFVTACPLCASAVYKVSSGGYGLICRDSSQYPMLFEAISDATVTSSRCNGSVKVVDGDVYYQVTGTDTWTKVTNWRRAGATVAAKCEGNKLYWQHPTTGVWTLLANGPDSVNACYTYVQHDGTYRYMDIDGSGWHTLTDSDLIAALAISDPGTVLGVVGVDNFYGSEVWPAIVTTKGIFVPTSGSYFGHSVSDHWTLFPFRDALIATSILPSTSSGTMSWPTTGGDMVTAAMLKYENGSHYLSTAASGSYRVAWSDISSRVSISGTINSLGYVDSAFTYVTDGGYTTLNTSSGATSTTEWPASLPEYVQDTTEGIKLKVSGTSLMVSAAYGWVAVGYKVVEASGSERTAPALLTATGSTWMKNELVLSALSSIATSTRALSVANDSDTWIVACELGVVSGSLGGSTAWPVKFNSAVVPLTGIYEDDDYQFACLEGQGIIMSIDQGQTWYPSILAYGTVKGIAMSGVVRVAAGTFGLRVCYNRCLSNEMCPYSVHDSFVWLGTYGDDVFENATFDDIAVYNGTFIASGPSGIYKATVADPYHWTRVVTAKCGKILRSELCWVVLTAGGVYRSEDLETWTKVTIGTDSSRLRELAVSVDGVFVVASSTVMFDKYEQDLYYSNDGLTWNLSSIQLTSSLDTTNISSFSSLAEHGGYVYITRPKSGSVGVGGLWVSKDRGATWESVTAMAGLDFNRVGWSDRGQCLYVGGRGGIYSSRDGVNWSRLTAGYWTARADILCIDDTSAGTAISVSPLTAFSYNGNNVYYTSVLGYPIRKAYKCIERIKVPGPFDKAKWEEVADPSRNRLEGIGSLCIPDVTLYS